jgi:pilus assembly protein CpaF
VSLQEIVGMEGSVIIMQELFSFQQTGVGEHGVVEGLFKASGIRPRFAERFKALGIQCSGIM